MIRFVLCLILFNIAWTYAVPKEDGLSIQALANALRNSVKALRAEGPANKTADADVMAKAASNGVLKKSFGRSNRIVNGDEVRPHSLPWQAGLILFGDPANLNCGATILCPKFLMTAAHCVTDGQKNVDSVNKFKVIVGAHNLEAEESSRVQHDIKEFHVHPSYWPSNAQYDCAIVEVKKAIKLKKEAMAVYLPNSNDNDFSGGSLVVSGWGDQEYCDEACQKAGKNGNPAYKLMVTSLPAVSEDVCMQTYSKQGITEASMCAGDKDKMSTDACQGDSGGPLTWLDKATDKVKLVGVVSVGIGCAEAGYPGIYQKITYVLDWIEVVMGKCNKETCQKDLCMDKEKLHRDATRFFNKKGNRV